MRTSYAVSSLVGGFAVVITASCGGADSTPFGPSPAGMAGASVAGSPANGGSDGQGGTGASLSGASGGGGHAPLGGMGGADVAGAGGTEGGEAGSGGTFDVGGAAGSGGASVAGGSGGVESGQGGTSGSDSGGANAGQGGSTGAEGGSTNGEGGGAGTGEPVCGDGVLASSEMCCTPEWVEARVTAVVAGWGPAAVGAHCAGTQSQVGLTVCDSEVCASGAVGCNVRITGATSSYEPATSEVTGTMDLVISGRATLGFPPLLVTRCSFVATIDAMRYRADVVTETTAEQLTIRIADPTFEYDVEVTGCAAASEDILAVAEESFESVLREQLTSTLRHEEPCPY